MPKNYTKDELENGRWVTMKGTRVFIKDGETPQDAIDRALGKSKKQATKKKVVSEDSPEKYDADIPDVATPESINKYTKRLQKDSIEDIAWDFGKENHINIDRDVIENTNPRTLCMAMETIEDIKNKYGCTILTIKNATDDMVRNTPEALAWMGQDGCMYFNPKEFGQSNEMLEHNWAEGCENSRHFHPNSPYGVRQIIAHEMGHAVFNKYIQNIMNKNENISEDFGGWMKHWNECQEFVTHKYGWVDGDAYDDSPAYKELADIFDGSLRDELTNDAYIVKMFGKTPDYSLLGFANRDYNPGGISVYAKTNYHEMMAEAFADVYDNGINASFVSKFLFSKIIKEMKK